MNPLSLRYLREVMEADIVHIHHIHTLVSDMSCLAASTLGKRAFVTDYGGGASLTLSNRLPVFEAYRGAIAYSRFGMNALPSQLKQKAVLIKGGIDTERFHPNGSGARENKILYVGRILPHKGINYLIEGFRLLDRRDYKLKVIGRVYDEGFYEYLKELSRGLAVEFIHDADDERLLGEYRTARVTVLPSVHRSYRGDYSAVPELMGFTLLESQACGTPVVCTDAGAMHEFVDVGRTGFVVEQNSSNAIALALEQVISAPSHLHSDHQEKCREFVQPLEWSKVVRVHLRLYSAGASIY
jgi:glycosyltransferase involved in cell wall biosynthesis